MDGNQPRATPFAPTHAVPRTGSRTETRRLAARRARDDTARPSAWWRRCASIAPNAELPTLGRSPTSPPPTTSFNRAKTPSSSSSACSASQNLEHLDAPHLTRRRERSFRWADRIASPSRRTTASQAICALTISILHQAGDNDRILARCRSQSSMRSHQAAPRPPAWAAIRPAAEGRTADRPFCLPQHPSRHPRPDAAGAGRRDAPRRPAALRALPRAGSRAHRPRRAPQGSPHAAVGHGVATGRGPAHRGGKDHRLHPAGGVEQGPARVSRLDPTAQ